MSPVEIPLVVFAVWIAASVVAYFVWLLLRRLAQRPRRCSHGDCPICRARANELQLRAYAQGMRIGKAMALPPFSPLESSNGDRSPLNIPGLWTRYLT